MSFIRELFKRRELLNPSMFNDETATRTSWYPLKRGGANFKTHKLVFEENGDASFKPSIGSYLLPGVLVAFSIGFAYIFINKGINEESIMPFMFVLIPLGFAIVMFIRNQKHRVFSPMNGVYYKGKKPESGNTVSDKNYALLADIHALQLIRERVRSSKSSYNSYELNLVLKNGHRVNVVDHGNLDSIRNDTKKLAEFLQVPVWDAIDYRV